MSKIIITYNTLELVSLFGVNATLTYRIDLSNGLSATETFTAPSDGIFGPISSIIWEQSVDSHEDVTATITPMSGSGEGYIGLYDYAGPVPHWTPGYNAESIEDYDDGIESSVGTFASYGPLYSKAHGLSGPWVSTPKTTTFHREKVRTPIYPADDAVDVDFTTNVFGNKEVIVTWDHVEHVFSPAHNYFVYLNDVTVGLVSTARTFKFPKAWFSTTHNTWRVDSRYTGPVAGMAETVRGDTWSFDLLEGGPKAINPTPADNEQSVETTPSILLQWEPGDPDNEPDSYKVYVGGGLSVEYQDEVGVPFYEYSGPIFGPSTHWHVDSTYLGISVEGDAWEFYPEQFLSTTYTLPNNPTPITTKTTAKFTNGVRCKWDGDVRSTDFRLFRSLNGGAYKEVT